MSHKHNLYFTVAAASLLTAACALSSTPSFAGPKIVSGPSEDPEIGRAHV